MSPSIIIGLGPSKLLISFYILSIVYGKNISIKDTTLLANCNIFECDLKLTVSYFNSGLLLNGPLCYNLNLDYLQKILN